MLSNSRARVELTLRPGPDVYRCPNHYAWLGAGAIAQFFGDIG